MTIISFHYPHLQYPMKKYLIILLTLVLALSFCACSGTFEEDPTGTTAETSETSETTTEAEHVQKDISFAYYSNDSLNPFKAAGETNAALSSLYCESLVTLDGAFSPVYSLAETIEKGEKTIEVKLKKGINFSNDSPLSGSDVVYSFNLAKESPIYGERLSNFTGAMAGTDTVTFSLNTENIYAENCLDFPIVQFGSGENDIVTGSGPFILKKSGDGFVLKENPNYSFAGEYEFGFSKIRLFDISKVTQPLYSVQIGDLSYYYDDLTGDPESRVKVNANSMRVSRNDLVFIGFNSNSAEVTPAMKKAVNLSLDREHATNSAFGMGAEAAQCVFNPLWNAVSEVKAPARSGASAAAQTVLIDDGYRLISGEIYTEAGERVTLKLLVPDSDSRKLALAQEVKSAAKKAGVNIEISAVPADMYLSSLKYGLYDLYIGETRLCADMDLLPFFTDGGALSYGIDTPALKDSAYSFMKGELDIQTFVDLFDDECPFIPVCYLNGIAYYSRLLDIEEEISENNIYSNLYLWKA